MILNTDETFIEESKARRDADFRRLRDLLRKAGLNQDTGLNRAHEVCTRKPPEFGEGTLIARPILIEVATSDVTTSF